MKLTQKQSRYLGRFFYFFIAFGLIPFSAILQPKFLLLARDATLSSRSHGFNVSSVAQIPEITRNSDNFAGFDLISTTQGVTLYKRDLNYVQVVDFSQGASVQLLTGEMVDPGSGNGAYGGNDPQFLREPLPESWEKLTTTHTNAFCMVNGQFFRNDQNPATGLAFPVKIDGNLVTDGYAGESEYAEEKMMLEVWRDRIAITAFTLDALRQSSAPNIIVSLREDADKGRDRALGRTFIGVKDSNQDNTTETLLILSSSAITQPEAAEILRELGATEIMMLDGGGSTQLLCQDIPYISSPRTIPQSIAILSAP